MGSAPCLGAPPHLASVASLRIPVPYQSQRDNSGGRGWRECFSSSCAMLAMHWRAVANDDAYNSVRSRFGDTTSAQAQLRALRALGLRADFWTNGDRLDIERNILGGRPVAVGWLHHGTISKPSGGGHWSVVVGLEGQDHFRMHDPYGEPLLRKGGHDTTRSGAGVVCSWGGFLPRWSVEGPGTGWYVTCSR